MKIRFLVLLVFVNLMVNCDGPSTTSPNDQPAQSRSDKPSVLNKDQAINIAKAEVIKEGKAIDKYDVRALEETKGWRVEFELKDRTTMGGGLIYVIDKETGNVLARQVSQ